jgi:pilus assembly protein CpaC
MTRFGAVTFVNLVCALVTLAVGLQGALQQGIVPGEGQILHIFVGKSVVINMQTRMTRILSSNPGVIETLATSPTQVVVEGKAAGSSSLILWDEAGQSQMLDVIVDLDVSGLRTAIEHAYPDQQVNVQSDAGRLILSGTVSDPRISDDLKKMAGLYSAQIVDSLTVPIVHDREVLLEVKFAEIDRTRIDQLGINILGAGALNTIGTISTQQFGPPSLGGGTGTLGGSGTTGGSAATTPLSVPDLLNIFLFRPDLNLAATIRDLQSKAVLQILAEPNLMALSGQKASFLAGGQFPFPIVQGGQNVGVVTIQFRDFGVKLDFTGTIGRDDVIRLHVAPEVSTLDFTNSITISGFVVPAISTRKAETEIELKDGQSFGIAGLLDHRAQAQMNKIPGIGDIPILGQLFRSKSVNRSNTELLVIVTPHIADPIRAPSSPPVEPKLALPYLDVPKFDEKLPESKNLEAPRQPQASKK